MRNLFKHTVRTAFRMELVDLAVQAVDGTKVRANAANDRTYDDEALRRLLKRSERTICDLEVQNEAGEDAAPANLPQELAGREELRERMRRALENPYHKDQFVYDEATDRYRCPKGQWLRFTRMKRTRQTMMRLYRASGAVCRACPAFGVCTTDGRHGRALEIGPHDAALLRHRAWMSTEEAKRAYRQRKQLVEPVFGIIKEQQQAQRFLLRGLPNVAAEWTLLATAFNLRTLWRIWRAQAPDPEFTNVSQRRIGALPRYIDRSPLRNGAKLPACVLRAINPTAVLSTFQRIRLAPIRLILSPAHF